ncbi:hypothetical protein ACFSYH_02050 [Populibacterium corticicola]|uniref:PD-(D/E)XK endonuclease-like domain-containing protein n=1 Tax=Populibacterium corticicola TaxID=1812826 RepID=A0ABW5XD82_9MICO
MSRTFTPEYIHRTHAPFLGLDPVASLKQARHVIEHAITHQPRSLQKRIGPSELGTPCDHCLAAKLAGWQQTERGVPWLPYIGTSVHEKLEAVFVERNFQLEAEGKPLRYLMEQKTMVGTVGGQEIWGSTDLVDLEAGMTVDWKIVGASTLKQAKSGPSPVYHAQADLYAKGWNDAGIRIDHVAIAYLPRNAVSLDQAVWWTAPHDRARAEHVLQRANNLALNLTVLESISIEARDTWITALTRDSHCYDCARFPDAPPARPRDTFFDLPTQ